jgi:phosphatidylinositol-3-phosphatase
MVKCTATVVALCTLALLEWACGGSSSSAPTTTVDPSQSTFSHVILLVEENHSYSDVVGSSSMPYLNSLISQYGLATQYFANTHPSLPNYLVLTTGLMESNNDNFAGAVTDDNIVRELVKAGKSWKAYLESLPSPGYLGGDTGSYLRQHNPFADLSDIQQSSAQAANMVPFTQFATDLANNALPQYSFIAPDANDDAHDGTLAQADSWLQSNIAPLLASSAFQSSGLLIVTFDESEDSDIQNGGGHVATVIVSPRAKKGFQSQTLYQHQSTLRLVLTSSGLDTFPGMSAAAPDMTEFFTGN